jgi:hypothetical protein
MELSDGLEKIPSDRGSIPGPVGKGIAEYCRQLVLIPALSSGGYGFQTLHKA